jgi:hypothetical protein
VADEAAEEERERSAQLLSAQAFELAKRVAAQAPTEAHVAEASTLADQVVGMQTPDAPPSVSKALTDALLDLDWIRSKCMLPTSTRLHWYLEEQGLPLPGT